MKPKKKPETVPDDPPKRKRGRPPGTKKESKSKAKRYGISLPPDVAAFLDRYKSPSATIERALRLLMDSRRK